nr:PREDICTED: uncharacterized protein LOC105669109 isoform X1 [Linepithema humile]
MEESSDDSKDSSGWAKWANSILASAEASATKATTGSVPSCVVIFTAAKKQPHPQLEAAFADLKCRAFKGELPMQIDKFVIRHIDWLKGKVLLSFADTACKDTIEKIGSNNNDKDNMDCSNDNEKDTWTAVENWRGLTTKSLSSDKGNVNKKQTDVTSKKNKLSYLDDCPDWDHMTTMKRVTIPLLKNGNLLKGSHCGNNCKNIGNIYIYIVRPFATSVGRPHVY